MNKITFENVQQSFFDSISSNKTLDNVLHNTFDSIESLKPNQNYLYSKEDKFLILRALLDCGANNLREFVNILADKLLCSRITVYNYIKDIERQARCQQLKNTKNLKIG